MVLRVVFGLLVLCIYTFGFVFEEPIIIGHRGASGCRPENTLASFEKAIALGADYIEADIVSTKDHVLVASHNPDITENTDVASHAEFSNRYREKNVSGEIYKGYFIDDFTIDELRRLRTRERFHFRDHSFDDLFPIPTLQEIISLVKAKEKELHRRIGLYLETKHPSYYRTIGLPLEERMVQILNTNGYNKSTDSIYIESFESNLIQMRKITELPLVQLVSGTEGDLRQFDTQILWSEITSDSGLSQIAQYANVVAPHRSCIFIPGTDGQPVLTTLIDTSHKLGLKVHVWTFRKEKNEFDEKKDKIVFYKTIQSDIMAHFRAGVDGIFTDHSDIGIEMKEEFLRGDKLKTILYYCLPIFVILLGIVLFLKSIERPSNPLNSISTLSQNDFNGKLERSNSF